MNVSELKKRLTGKIMSTAESIIENKARTFTALLKYEIAVANTELAMRSNEHGYDFKFIPDDLANAIVIGKAERGDGQVTLNIKIPPYAFADYSDEFVKFFKTYVVANVATKLRNGI